MSGIRHTIVTHSCVHAEAVPGTLAAARRRADAQPKAVPGTAFGSGPPARVSTLDAR